ncbi:unnamed protein product [Caretta caretta]
MKSTESLEVKDLKLPTILMTNQRLHHGNGQKNTWHGSHKQCGAVREHNHEKNGNNMMFSLFCAGTVVYGLMPKGGESRIFKRVLQQKEIELLNSPRVFSLLAASARTEGLTVSKTIQVGVIPWSPSVLSERATREGKNTKAQTALID